MLMRNQIEILSILLFVAIIKVAASSVSMVHSTRGESGGSGSSMVSVASLEVDPQGKMKVDDKRFNDTDALARYLAQQGKVNVVLTGEGQVPVDVLKAVKRSFDKLHLNLYL